MEPDQVAVTGASTPVRGGPSGSQARRGSASAASRAKTGATAVQPPSPIRTADSKVIAPAVVEAAHVDDDLEVVEATETGVEASVDEFARADAVGAEVAAVATAVGTTTAIAPAPAAGPAAAAELAPAPARVPAPRKSRPAKAPVRTTPVRDAAPASPAAKPLSLEVALEVVDLSKSYGDTKAADSINLEVRAGSIFGIVGPNGAGKTTTLSMISGLLRPDSGEVRVYGADVWANAAVAKKSLGVLPDRLRLFDRLTGAEFLQHAGALHGLDRKTAVHRAADLAAAFGLQPSMRRFVSDYSVGLTKKIAIAAALIHSPRLLVLDEPFESVDPVSAQTVIDILKRFTEAGGTVLLSSHSMELIQRVCDSVAIIADGRVLTAGPIETVLDGRTLEARFVELAGGTTAVEGMEWLQSFSD